MRTSLAVVLIALSSLFGLAGAAHAKGGPTSVLIIQPGEQRATAHYVASPHYVELERLLNSPGLSDRLPHRGLGNFDHYQVVWIDHALEPWRTDTVFIMRSGKEYVLTSGPDSWFGNDAVPMSQREPARSGELKAHLERLFAEPTPEAEEPAAVEQLAVAPAEVTTRWFSLTGWRWAFPGALGALLVGLVALHLRRNRPDTGGVSPAHRPEEEPCAEPLPSS